MSGLPVKVPVLWAFGGVFLALIIASLTTLLLASGKPQADYTELKQRMRTWWVMVGIFAVAVVVSRNTAVVFFAILSFLALKEYLSLIPTRRADRRVLFWAYLAVPLQFHDIR